MSAECSWKCEEGYLQQADLEGAPTCAATCSIFSCSKEKNLVALPNSSSMVGDTADICCEDLGCKDLEAKAALPEGALEKGGCNVVKSEEECNTKYVISGNVHKTGKGATVYTACTWDSSQDLCNWGSQQLKNCVL